MQLFTDPVCDALTLHVEMPIGRPGEIAVYATDGRLIESRQVINVGSPIRLNVSSLCSGMYLLVSRFGSRNALRRFIRE